MATATRRKRVLLFGTHPNQFNGYSKVVYNLTKRLEEWRGNDTGDLELYVHGFQNFHDNVGHDRTLRHAKVYDAFAFEHPKGQGFGFAQIDRVYDAVRPHLCIVYNDMIVVTNVLQQIAQAQQRSGWNAHVVVYVDQVYDCQKPHFIQLLNSHCFGIVAFTDFWKRCLLSQGLRTDLPMRVLPHGVDPLKNYPIPMHVARKYLGLDAGDFLVYNANRNQPRKRWDTCVIAFTQVVARHLGEKIRLVVGTTASEGGAWNIAELFQFEFRRLGVPLEEGMKHVVFVDKPQMLTDEDINAMYNATDIGINTCDGEGFGLCNFEHAAVGRPQIVPNIGGFRDIFDEDTSILIDPTSRLYVDSSRDSVGGMTEICDADDFARAIERYYADAELRRAHGRTARQRIVRKFAWDDVAREYESIIDDFLPPQAEMPPPESATETEPEPPTEAEPEPASATTPPQEPPTETEPAGIDGDKSKGGRKRKEKAKTAKNRQDVDREEIAILSARLESLLKKAEAERTKKKNPKRRRH